MDYQEAMRKAQAFREKKDEEERKKAQAESTKIMDSDAVKNSLSIYNPVMEYAPEEMNVRPEHMPQNVTPHIQNKVGKGLAILNAPYQEYIVKPVEKNIVEPIEKMAREVFLNPQVTLSYEEWEKKRDEAHSFLRQQESDPYQMAISAGQPISMKKYQAQNILSDNPVASGEINYMTPEEQAELPAFQKGMTQSIGYKSMGLQGIDLPEDAPLSDKIKFALGKGVADLPVFAGLATGGAVIGLPAFLGAGLLFGGYEALDSGVDAYSRQKYGTELPDMEGVDPVVYGLEHFGPGALKGMAGHGLGKVAMGGVGLLQRLAVKNGANAFTAHKVATVMKPLAYEVAQNEVIGQASAIQHGYDYDMEQRYVDIATTSIMNVASKGSRNGVEILKAKPKIEGETAAGSTLDDVVETYKNKVVDDVAIDTARKHFVQGGTPEETARLTMVKMEEMSGREGMGHPFKNPEDRFNFIKRVSEQAKEIHENHYDELSLNRRDVLVDDVLPIGDLGKGNNYSTYKKLLELRGKEVEYRREYQDKVRYESPAVLDEIKQRIEQVQNEQQTVYETMQRSRTNLYAAMKKEVKRLDALRKTEEIRRDAADVYNTKEEIPEYAAQSAQRLVNLTDSQILELSKTANMAPSGKIANWYNKNIKSASRMMDVMLGERNSTLVKAALRGAEAIRTKTLDRMYKSLEEVRKRMTEQDERIATIHMIKKQVARKRAKNKETGEYNDVLVNVGEKHLAAMLDEGYVTQAEIDASANLNQVQMEFVGTSRAILDEIWGITNKARKMMGKNEIEALPDYFPLSTDVDSIDANGYTSMRKIGWLEDNPYRKRLSPGDPKNILKRGSKEKMVRLDGTKVMEQYARYMVNKGYMNPVAHQMMKIGKNLNKLQGKGAGTDIMAHAKFISGDVDPVGMWDKAWSTLARNVSQSMLVMNYSTYITQLSALDGIVAECGYLNVQKTINELAANPKLWAEIQNESAHLTARKGGGDISIVDLANSLKGDMRKKLVEKGMYPIQALDMVASTIAFRTFYNKAKNNFGMKDADARIYADDMVVRTQASASRIDVPPVMRNSLGKFLFTLQTFSLNRFDYMVSDIFGVQPVYKFMEHFDDEATANAVGKQKGWVVQKLNPKGKQEMGYAVYDPKQTRNYMEAVNKMVKLLVVQSLFNLAYDGLEELTTLPFAKPSPDPVGAFFEKRDGVSIVGKLIGKPERGSNLEMSERNRRGYVAAAQEATEMIPGASGYFKYQDSIAGAPIGKMISSGRRFANFLETGNINTGLKAMNDLSTLAGNPLYAPINKLLIRYSRMEKEEEQYEAARKREIKELKKKSSRANNNRHSRSNLRIER